MNKWTILLVLGLFVLSSVPSSSSIPVPQDGDAEEVEEVEIPNDPAETPNEVPVDENKPKPDEGAQPASAPPVEDTIEKPPTALDDDSSGRSNPQSPEASADLPEAAAKPPTPAADEECGTDCHLAHQTPLILFACILVSILLLLVILLGCYFMRKLHGRAILTSNQVGLHPFFSLFSSNTHFEIVAIDRKVQEDAFSSFHDNALARETIVTFSEPSKTKSLEPKFEIEFEEMSMKIVEQVESGFQRVSFEEVEPEVVEEQEFEIELEEVSMKVVEQVESGFRRESITVVEPEIVDNSYEPEVKIEEQQELSSEINLLITEAQERANVHDLESRQIIVTETFQSTLNVKEVRSEETQLTQDDSKSELEQVESIDYPNISNSLNILNQHYDDLESPNLVQRVPSAYIPGDVVQSKTTETKQMVVPGGKGNEQKIVTTTTTKVVSSGGNGGPN